MERRKFTREFKLEAVRLIRDERLGRGRLTRVYRVDDLRPEIALASVSTVDTLVQVFDGHCYRLLAMLGDQRAGRLLHSSERPLS